MNHENAIGNSHVALIGIEMVLVMTHEYGHKRITEFTKTFFIAQLNQFQQYQNHVDNYWTAYTI